MRISPPSHGLKARKIVPALVVTAMGASLALTSPASAAPVVKVNGYAATAYGSQISLIGKLHSGPTALTSIGCSKLLNQTTTNSSLAIDAGAAGRVGAVETQIRTYPSYAGVSDTSDSHVADVNLLGGLITSGAIEASSTARATGTALSSFGSSSLLSLKIAGTSINAAPAANTKIDLTGLGYVILNQQVESKAASHISRSVIALHVVVTNANALGLPLGSDIKVGYAAAGLARYVPGLVSGHAYGTEVFVGSAVRSGPTSLAANACLGGNSKSTLASLTNVPGVSAGAVTSTANASIASTGLELRNTNTIANVNLFGGLITADGITTVAHIHGTVGAPSYQIDSIGSKFVNLKIAGITLPVTVKPNTVLDVPGVGKVTLYRTTVYPSTIGVVSIQIVLSVPLSGLPIGTRIYVGVAYGTVIH